MEGKLLSLTDRERAVKRKLVEATKSIRKKIRVIRSGVSAGEDVFQKTFKPLIEPLTEVVNVVKAQKPVVVKHIPPPPSPIPPLKEEALQKLDQKIDAQRKALHIANEKLEALSPVATEVKHEEEEEGDEEGIHPKALEYLKDLSETPQHFDTQYGPRMDKNQLKMGNVNIRFGIKTIKLMRGTDVINKYMITPELLKVLFTNTSPINVSEKTKETYVEMLDVTNAIRKGYNGNSGIQGTRSQKYSAFIKPLLEENNLLAKTAASSSWLTPSRPPIRKGEGFRKYLTPRVDYRYWDSPKELVDRLRLLWASREAGNNSHHNEIVAILEELREAGVIY